MWGLQRALTLPMEALTRGGRRDDIAACRPRPALVPVPVTPLAVRQYGYLTKYQGYSARIGNSTRGAGTRVPGYRVPGY